jgi:hypothetical protein
MRCQIRAQSSGVLIWKPEGGSNSFGGQFRTLPAVIVQSRVGEDVSSTKVKLTDQRYTVGLNTDYHPSLHG